MYKNSVFVKLLRTNVLSINCSSICAASGSACNIWAHDFMCLVKNALCLPRSLSYARMPVANSNSTTPKLNVSTLVLSVQFIKNSTGRYGFVPYTRDTSIGVLSSPSRARPKSPIFGWLQGSKRMLAGLISPWIRGFLLNVCKYCRPLKTTMKWFTEMSVQRLSCNEYFTSLFLLQYSDADADPMVASCCSTDPPTIHPTSVDTPDTVPVHRCCTHTRAKYYRDGTNSSTVTRSSSVVFELWYSCLDLSYDIQAVWLPPPCISSYLWKRCRSRLSRECSLWPSCRWRAPILCNQSAATSWPIRLHCRMCWASMCYSSLLAVETQNRHMPL